MVEVIVLFIGFAPKSSQPLFDFIKRKGLNETLLLELGVIANGDQGRYAQMWELYGKVYRWKGRCGKVP